MEKFLEVLNVCKELLPTVVSLSAVIVSGIAIKGSRKTQLTSTYFSEKTKAYSDYLDCVARFVYHPADSTRDNLSSALYRIRLYASDDVLESASAVYLAAIEWSRAGGGSAQKVDDAVNCLSQRMRKDLAGFDHR